MRNLMLFLSPYYDNSNIAGFSIVSYIDGKPRSIESAVGTSASSLSTAILDAQQSNSYQILIYEFPDLFIIKDHDCYFWLSDDGEFNEFEKDSTYSSDTTNCIRALNQQSSIPVQRVGTEYAALKDWRKGSFIPITDGSKTYYGCYQDWLADYISQGMANKSCGIAAASNLLYYISKNQPGKSNLYKQTGLSKSQFSSFMMDVYPSFNVTAAGIYRYQQMVDGLTKYAKSCEVSITCVDAGTVADMTLGPARNFVVAGLKAECPVLMMTAHSFDIPDLAYHWVTITRIYNDGDGTTIVTSNWGEQRIYDFELWIESGSLIKILMYVK